ncbi:uncharacterized protein [Dermacentor albipictus]|uniref:uncharacterized protein n=1 Tax=Dermacentor albipictus TaxID=60249 RepID=UPI0038FC0981
MKSGAGAADVTTVKWKHFLAMQAIMEPISEEPMLYSSLDFLPEENLQDQDEVPGTSGSSVPSSRSATPAAAATESQPTEDDLESDTDRTPRRKKARRSPRKQQSPLKAPQHAAVTAACMEHLQAVRTERQQKQQLQREPQDAVYHTCMALAAQLRMLGPRDQSDAIFEIQTMMYHRLQGAMNEQNSH